MDTTSTPKTVESKSHRNPEILDLQKKLAALMSSSVSCANGA